MEAAVVVLKLLIMGLKRCRGANNGSVVLLMLEQTVVVGGHSFVVRVDVLVALVMMEAL